VRTDDGTVLRYARLLLATGASPRRLSIPGSDLPGVRYLRTLEDADALRGSVEQAETVAVIGGGWIGAEVTASLRETGREVALVAPSAVPLQRLLGDEFGSIYLALHREHGVELVMGARVAEIVGSGSVEGVRTEDGRTITCDAVLAGIGTLPRTELASQAALAADDGVLVNEYLESSAPGIYAAGDVASVWHPLFGCRVRVEHWDNAKRQGTAVAKSMLGRGEPYARIPYFYSDQYDVAMEYTGYAPTWDRVVVRGDTETREFVAFWLRDGRVAAGMSANVDDTSKPVEALIRSGRRVNVERLTDSAVSLDDLDAVLVTNP